ncbi:MAG TPA: hypothetical protein VFN02_08065 [Ktedonobacteraceae bacterium]|nr:hypothetical protein [Ktedonobacteraceae bacterium]
MAETFTDADIQSLAHKMVQFSQTLTSGEQAAFAEVVLRGALKSGDVEGYFDRRPNEGAVGVQEGVGDPFSPITNIFSPQTRPGRDRPEDRR